MNTTQTTSTKTPQVWTHETRVYLYRQLLNKVGVAWSRYDWKVKTMRPKDHIMSCAAFNKAFQEIYDDMESKGFSMFAGSDREPKSHLALKQQFEWCVSTQCNKNRGQVCNERWNRLAAYEAGFLSMSDIVYLESVEEMRFYTGI